MQYFNRGGANGLIIKTRPGTVAIINDQQAPDSAKLIDQAILDDIDNYEKARQTTAIETFCRQTL